MHGTAVSVAVLAGGRSRRMGTDKRLVEVAGRSLLGRVLDVVAALTDDLRVVTARDNPLPAGVADDVTVSFDRRVDAGPLAGIEAALLDATHEVVLVVAGDHPWLHAGVLTALVERLEASRHAEAAAVVTERGPQPLLAAYRRSTLATVQGLLDVGERRATALLEHLSVEPVELDTLADLDPRGESALDVDRPSDLAPGGRS